jgi:tRNA(fMet)-specific endonuclease VapC
MSRYLLDTNAVGDFMNDRFGIPDRIREAKNRGAIVGTCEPVVAELYFGVENSGSRDENLRRVAHVLTRLRCWPLDRKASQEYGRLASLLRRTGRVMGHMDILIASIALTIGDCVVVSTDADLRMIPGLSVEDWRI